MTSWIPDATFLPTTRGLSVRLPATAPDADGRRTNGANGLLENALGQRVGLWVNKITTGFELSGSTAQSARQRDFYPHNFTQPSITVSGQTSNNYEYNRLADFIRQSQIDALSFGPNETILKFICLQPDSTKQPHRPLLRGRHRHLSIDGFVAKSKKGAVRFVTAHDYEFDFIVLDAQSLLGLQDNVTIPFLTHQTVTGRLEAGRTRLTKKNATDKLTPESGAAQDDPAVGPLVAPGVGIPDFPATDLGLLPGAALDPDPLGG